MSSSENLPTLVFQFLQAIHDHDSSALASTFSPTAIMIDESKAYNGPNEIKTWSEEALFGRKATIQVKETTVIQHIIHVRLIMDGDFVEGYGITEPFTLYFHFELNSNQTHIESLSIDTIAPTEPTMRAVWASGGDLVNPLSKIVVGLRRIPDKSEENWVKVKVTAAAINHHDIFTLRGIGFHPIKFPIVLGNEGVGTLDDGSEVMIYPLIENPDWKGDPTLDPKRHVLGELTQGSLAEYVLVPKANIVPKPKNISTNTAAVLGIAWLTAWRMLFTHGKVQKGQTVLVQGSSGGVATALIQLGVAAGIHVWATGRTAEKRSIAQRLGAERTFDSNEKLPEPVDVVFDMSGSATVNHSIASVRPGGAVIAVGAHSGERSVNIDYITLFVNQVRLMGTYLGTPEEFRDLVKFVSENNIIPEVELTIPLENAREGFRKIVDGEVRGKVVVTL